MVLGLGEVTHAEIGSALCPYAKIGASFIGTMLWSLDSTSSVPLQAQIAGCIRRAIASGELRGGDRLPAAAELGPALGVDRNTVLAAYRGLRADGLLEFRRGRGVRVCPGAHGDAEFREAMRSFVALAEAHGYRRADLARLMMEDAP